jgi:tetratricopeptide (TPR) repeat protein
MIKAMLRIITFCVASSLLLTSSAYAQEKQFLLKQATYDELTKAQQALEAEDYSKARAVLDALLVKVEKGSYDQAVIYQNLAYLYASNERFADAIKYFQAAMALDALPADVTHNLLFNLGQLQLAEQQYKPGIANIEKWLNAEPKPANDSYVLLASAYYQIKNYKQVISYISKAIKNDKSPVESWYQLLLAAHFELKQYKSAIKVLEIMVTRYPYKKQYWQQLSYLYFDQNKEMRAIAVSALAEKLALTDKQSVMNLANMYRYLQIPYKAAQLLEQYFDKGVIKRDFENLEKLADSWLAARELDKATAVLSEMAKNDTSGATDLKLARVFTGSENWQKAVAPLSNSLEKLPKQERGLPILLLGTAYYYLNKTEQAEKMFEQALQYKEFRVQANQWLTHLAQ